MLVMVSVALACVGESNALRAAAGTHRLCGEIQGTGEKLTDGAVPVPERLIVCRGRVIVGEGDSSRFASRSPSAEKVMLMAQLAPAATLEPQVLVWESRRSKRCWSR